MSEPIKPFIIEHKMYDKISDDLIFLGQNCIVRFNVSLSNYNSETEEFNSYHREYVRKNKNGDSSILIRRSFNYYISIENIKYDPILGIKEYIMIGVNDIQLLISTLEAVSNWFVESNNIYTKNAEGKLFVKANNCSLYIENLPMGKWLSFFPTIISYPNGDEALGVRIHLSDKNNFTDVNLSNFMGFLYQIKNINMFTSAQNMINYLQRPEFGSNLNDFSNNNNTQQSYSSKYTSHGTGVPGRMIGGDIKE